MTVIGIPRLHGRCAERDHIGAVTETKTSETKNKNMKIVIIGGTGLIGARLVNHLRLLGQREAVAASPSKGINSITGEGLAAALAGAQAGDVTTLLGGPGRVGFGFDASTLNLLAAEAFAELKPSRLRFAPPSTLSVVADQRLFSRRSSQQ